MGATSLSDDEVPSVLRGAVEAEHHGYILGLYEDSDREFWSLQFMECIEPDEQDRASGTDAYCLAAGWDGQWICYGGVVECEIGAEDQPTLPLMPPSDRSELRLALTPQAAEMLHLPTSVRFALHLTPEQLLMVKRGLVRVLTTGRPDATPRLLQV
ncbi:hypothetical protein KBX37_21295 [Micromonospora sp. U56]|uniref:hypothetical protein n=1 Tax=Micromonospora sp. U56 TaxID=2824900 RepID=UPI001B3830A8|nr:hypothetical protein [Micromonospora sp. U56]MBQ0895601.1 hypothetical protein [Micromonospora sp. U56]